MGRTWTAVVAGTLAIVGLLAIGWLADFVWMRILFGIPLVTVLPGFLLLWAIFPDQAEEGKGLRWLERLVLSVGLSIVLSSLLGLLLESLDWFNEEAFVGFLIALVLALLVAAVLRSLAVPEAARWPTWEPGPLTSSVVVLGVLALAASGAVVAFMADPADDARYTEVGLLGSTGDRTCYPAAYSDGSYRATMRSGNVTRADPACPVPSGNVTVVVASHEGGATTYTLAVWWARGDGQGPVAVSEILSRTFTIPGDASDVFRETITLPPPPASGDHFVVFQVHDGSGPSFGAGRALPDAEHEVRLAISGGGA
jgi:hypothetical protein